MMCKSSLMPSIFAGVLLTLLSGCNFLSNALSSSDVDANAGDTTSDTTGDTTDDATSGTSSDTISDAQQENDDDHDDPADYVWKSADVVDVVFDGTTISAGAGATVAGSTVTITAAGTYRLSGTLTDGQVIVDAPDEALVRLLLNGVNLRSSAAAALYVANASKAVVNLIDGTDSYVSGGTSCAAADADTDTPNAAVYSTCDLTIFGGGALAVDGNCNDGIASKDGLIITGGTIAVQAVDDGIRGKDYVIVHDGSLAITAGGDGVKADNETDAAKGYVAVESGTLDVVAGGDAIAAQTDLLVSNGQLTLVAGGGRGRVVTGDASAKGLKGTVSVIIEGGEINVDAADDAIHSNGFVTIGGGTCAIATSDDGIHGDNAVTVNAGTIRINDAYEGIESRAAITINGGNIHVNATDDGLNVATGNDGSGTGGPQGPGGRPDQGGGPQLPGGQTSTGSGSLGIHGGRLVIDAAGDGIDVAGSVRMTGGQVFVNGPTNDGNGALDHSSFTISGGTLVAVGSAGMAQGPGTASTQCTLMITLNSAQAGGTLVHVQTQQGDEVLTFAPSKTYRSAVFSSPKLTKGTTYNLYLGGSASGTASDGLYAGGYTPGTKYATMTLSNVVTNVR